MNEVRLIDANALKYKNLAEVNGKLTYVLTAEEINNAPTVEPEITEKQAIAKLINCGWLVKHDKELRDKWERPHGKWKNVGFMVCECDNCKEQFHELEANNYCPNCGADKRNPNCVTCDHFGKCDGCEKGEEE